MTLFTVLFLSFLYVVIACTIVLNEVLNFTDSLTPYEIPTRYRLLVVMGPVVAPIILAAYVLIGALFLCVYLIMVILWAVGCDFDLMGWLMDKINKKAK